MRRQVFVAVCDDLILRDRVAIQLQTEINQSNSVLSHHSPRASSSQPYPQLVSLQLNLDDPNPLIQIAQWLTQSPPPTVGGQSAAMPTFQILGVEHLTRQAPAVQRLFFTHLQTFERNLPLLDFSILIWTTRPWYYAISQSAPEFWRCRTGVFEFVGDPTPLSVTSPERFGVQSSQQVVWRPPTAVPPKAQPAAQENQEARQEIHSDRVAPPLEAEKTIAPPPPDPDNLPDDSPDDLSENPWAALAEDLNELYESLEEERRSVDGANDGAVSQRREQLRDDRERSRQTVDLPSSKAAEKAPIATPAIPSTLARYFRINETEAPPAAEVAKAAVLPLKLPDTLSDGQGPIKTLLEQIEVLQQHQAPPTVLAEAYRALGNCFRDRIEQGELTPQNLVIAIQAYEQVLRCLPESSLLWVDVLNDLGNLYWMMSRAIPNPGEALPYLKQGIHAYQLALTKIDPDTQAQTYPMVQNNLGAAYADLARHHEPVQHLELSVQSYRQALRYRKPETDPLRYASTQNNLGTTYWNLAQYKDPVLNLKAAIAAYSEALRYYQPDREPINYAMIQNNLGTAYWNLSQHEYSQDWLKSAVSSYQMALKYRTLEAAPAAHAATQNNLGTAYWHVANYTEHPQERLECLQQAIVAYEAALHAVDYLYSHHPQAAPSLLNFDRFATHNNLGLAHYQIATDQLNGLDTDAQSAHLQAALEHHVAALQGWEKDSNLRQTAMNCIIQAVRAAYNQLGLPGQSLALAKIPGQLLPEILPKL